MLGVLATLGKAFEDKTYITITIVASGQVLLMKTYCLCLLKAGQYYYSNSNLTNSNYYKGAYILGTFGIV